MATRTIKGIPDEDWMEFKSLAAQTGSRMGDVFKAMLKAYEKEKRTFWKSLFSTGKIMSDKDAKIFENSLKELRKESGFRDDISI